MKGASTGLDFKLTQQSTVCRGGAADVVERCLGGREVVNRDAVTVAVNKHNIGIIQEKLRKYLDDDRQGKFSILFHVEFQLSHVGVETWQHFGSSPLDVANIWYDLMETDIAEAQVSEKEKSQKGFKRFMAVNYWLWVYPKNPSLLASWFKICKQYSRGEHIKKWVKRIAP
jgi:hypothetical protein